MQNADIISINIWSIIISLANLVILFLIIKKFLYKRVKKALAERQASVDAVYAEADAAAEEARKDQEAWAVRMAEAESEAAGIVSDAAREADRRSQRIVGDAQSKADDMLRQAEAEIEREKKKAEADVKQEIIDVSAVLAGKMLEREVTASDHREMIDSFIDGLGKQDE